MHVPRRDVLFLCCIHMKRFVDAYQKNYPSKPIVGHAFIHECTAEND